jgi:hypothetical protein
MNFLYVFITQFLYNSHISNNHLVHRQEFMIYCGDELSVCIYYTIFVQLTYFEQPSRSPSGVHDLLYSAALYKLCRRV